MGEQEEPIVILDTDHLARYYPTACPAVGVEATPISAVAKDRHHRRYSHLTNMLLARKVVRFEWPIADVGCGSGYGTDHLRERFAGYPVYGIEPDDKALAYARVMYPHTRYYRDFEDSYVVANDNRTGKELEAKAGPPPKPKVAVFVESVEHMAFEQFHGYVGDWARVVALTVPLVASPSNPHHALAFKTRSDVRAHLGKAGFDVLMESVWEGVTFTTGEQGANYMGIYVRE